MLYTYVYPLCICRYTNITFFSEIQLLDALSPVLDMLYDQFPDCLPFRQPVDPVVLQIPVSNFAMHLNQDS